MPWTHSGKDFNALGMPGSGRVLVVSQEPRVVALTLSCVCVCVLGQVISLGLLFSIL